jgi:hypothetical protein
VAGILIKIKNLQYGRKKGKKFPSPQSYLTLYAYRLFLLKIYLWMSLKGHHQQVSITMSTHHALSKLARDRVYRQKN